MNESLEGKAFGTLVRVRGFGQTCRHGTRVAGAASARVRLIEPSDDGWLAAGQARICGFFCLLLKTGPNSRRRALLQGPWLGLPCCAAEGEKDDEEDEEDE